MTIKTANRKAMADAIKASRASGGRYEPIGALGWEVRFFRVYPSVARPGFAWPPHVEIRKIGHRRSSTFPQGMAKGVADSITAGEIAGSWVDEIERTAR